MKYYSIGQLKAARILNTKGFTKKAEEDRRSTLENVGVGLAGASPFLGLIGQKPIQHDPLMGADGRAFSTMEDLSRAAKPGDVILTSNTKNSIWKQFMSPLTGSEFYHAQPVTHRSKRKGKGTHGITSTAGEHIWKADDSTPYMKRWLAPISDHMLEEGYDDVILVRPKDLTPAQRKAVGDASVQRLKSQYSHPTAARSWLQDLFLPKIDALRKIGPQTVCEGNVCSTLPAQALKDVAGVDVVPGKRALSVMPADFLRSDNFELVGSHISDATRDAATAGPEWLRKLRPYRNRALIGAGLAAGTYGAQENPEAAGAVAGAGLANVLATAEAKKRFGDKFYEGIPRPWDIMESAIAGEGPKTNPTVYKNFLKRRLPALAAGGLMGLGGAKVLSDIFSKDEPKTAALNKIDFERAWDEHDSKPNRTYEEHKYGSLDPSTDQNRDRKDRDKRLSSAIDGAFRANENYDMSFGPEPGIINNINKIAISLGAGSTGSGLAASIPAVKPPSMPKANAMAPKAPTIKPVGLSKSELVKGQNKMDLGASVTSPMRRLQGSPL